MENPTIEAVEAEKRDLGCMLSELGLASGPSLYASNSSNQLAPLFTSLRCSYFEKHQTPPGSHWHRLLLVSLVKVKIVPRQSLTSGAL